MLGDNLIYSRMNELGTRPRLSFQEIVDFWQKKRPSKWSLSVKNF
jgi:hypothetical protein